METRPLIRSIFSHPTPIIPSGAILAPIILLTLMAGGCSSPIKRQSEKSLQQAMIRAIETEVQDAKQNPAPRSINTQLDLTQLGIRADHLIEIENNYSPDGYLAQLRDQLTSQSPDATDPISTLVGTNLLGQPTKLIGLTLEQTIQTSIANNLAVELASFAPAISQAALTQAQAQFDWLFFANAQYQDSIIPQAGQGFGGITRTIFNSAQTAIATTGISRVTPAGSIIQLSNDIKYSNIDSSFFGTPPIPNPANSANIALSITQPLLRGFGRDTNLAQIHLARNAERTSIAALKASLIDTASLTEKAYWTLVLRYKELIIRSKLLDRGIKVRDDIKARRIQDARQAQIADAVARVERRRSDLLIARTNLRNASDQLKLLMNDPAIPVGSELLIVPSDDSTAEPISFSLLDAITSAIKYRPELEQALLSIDDSSIQQQLAKNQRLPKLDLIAQARMLGFGDSFSDAYNGNNAGRFVDDWLLGFTFEQPIGNRAGEAGYRSARLARMQAVVAYRQAAQTIVLDVKVALNAVETNNQLIAQTTLSRVAQGEALRSLIVEKELTNAGYSVVRLNLELNQQEALANAEIAQATSLVNYKNALIDLYKAMGTTLERSRIDFIVPDANQLAPGESALDYKVQPPQPQAPTTNPTQEPPQAQSTPESTDG